MEKVSERENENIKQGNNVNKEKQNPKQVRKTV